MHRLLVTAIAAVAIASCAGRTPHPVAVSQPQDAGMSCAALQAEIQQNNTRITDMSSESSGKVAQNIAAGVGGVLIWPLWFAMDFQDAPGIEQKALQGRNNYLGTLAAEKCSIGASANPVTDSTLPAQAVNTPPPATSNARP